MPNSNFSFLSKEFPLLYQLSCSAEQYLYTDQQACFLKLRLFCESLTNSILEYCNINTANFKHRKQIDNQYERINLISRICKLDESVTKSFHFLRKQANVAVHTNEATLENAQACLKVSWYLSRWFYRSFGKNKTILDEIKYVTPAKPSNKEDENELIAKLQAQLSEQEKYIKQLQDEQKKHEEETNALLQKKEQELLEKFKQGDFEVENNLVPEAYDQLKQIKKNTNPTNYALTLVPQFFMPAKVQQELSLSSQEEATNIASDEALARQFIDQMLKDAGWLANSKVLNYKNGARPNPKTNLAIAEYPVKNGFADYVLFIGLKPVAILEAKKANISTVCKIEQAERYSIDFDFTLDHKIQKPYEGDQSSWPVDPNQQDPSKAQFFQIPFVIASNGTNYYDKDPEHSGTWFRDVRQASNVRYPIGSIPSPEDLEDLLKVNKEEALQKLSTEPFDYLRLRPYQEKAVQTVESALQQGKSRLLINMATGTGKTLVARALIYRLLKSGLFKRILFLVDRVALAEQAFNKFDEFPIENSLKLSQIYSINSNDDFNVQSNTKVQIATVQGLVRKLFSDNNVLSSGMFDCIIVDEAHRNYAQDKNAGDNAREILSQLGESTYLATYRRALDYFPATVIGFTATPSKQSIEIFGQPVYNYYYKDAVLDGYLVDYNPPLVLQTELSEKGIYISKGTEVQVYKAKTGKTIKKILPEDLDFKLRDFNIKVKNESFNQVICEQLVNDPRIDITSPRKTLIFCFPDDHADEIKHILDMLYHKKYGDKYDERAVQKITGKSENAEQLIKNFALEKYPNIAITVVLLSTGIDVPQICNLVFLRFISSPVLYQQMLGRATRLCPQIGKDSFNIFDAVGITALNLQEKMVNLEGSSQRTTMTTEQIVQALSDPKQRKKISSLPTELGNPNGNPNEGPTNGAEDLVVLFALKLSKLMNRARPLRRAYPDINELCTRIEKMFNCKAEDLRETIVNMSPSQLGQILASNPNLSQIMEQLQELCRPGREIIISTSQDKLKSAKVNFEETGVSAQEVILKLNLYLHDKEKYEPLIKKIISEPYLLTYEELSKIIATLFDEGFKEARIKVALNEMKLLSSENYNLIDALHVVYFNEQVKPLSERLDLALEQTLNSVPQQAQKVLKRIALGLKKELIFDESRFNKMLSDMGGLHLARKLCGPTLDEVILKLVKLSFSYNK